MFLPNSVIRQKKVVLLVQERFTQKCKIMFKDSRHESDLKTYRCLNGTIGCFGMQLLESMEKLVEPKYTLTRYNTIPVNVHGHISFDLEETYVCF